MNSFTRTLLSTFPLVCAAGVFAAPVAAHPAVPVCSGSPGKPAPAERHTAAAPTTPRADSAPEPVPVRVTVHDLTAVPPAAGRAAPVEVEIIVRGGGGGSAAELPTVLRDLVRAVVTPQRVPAPRPHR
ncbi:hypothetical protein FEK33_23910 [Nocardia asteroides NBRC 15531]|uniref:Uncharacterized protein n=1 Tax=Nocardia asteroides NBRC 15531 TaxID=1110697 RepID=U5E4Z5_NOCAS|nr:hypothetical protein [Nocardia asteroides]TLF64643.1 hypothetical protein FEK33_23910 [Nocardia asteroides NBRC 15531]UGT50237.1 hypothetical protein LT345_06535 [Nocardia asteroides]SFN14630.1 hypothetical protein SAMN05444423_106278 [Nocardia asteroides]VEG36989.1 Uncharacterised protein [Nocardia asteroides]GAD81955.1 hypothetical protein NCAST_05_03920 [Nocardia asteroides NBRC 15531]